MSDHARLAEAKLYSYFSSLELTRRVTNNTMEEELHGTVAVGRCRMTPGRRAGAPGAVQGCPVVFVVVPRLLSGAFSA